MTILDVVVAIFAVIGVLAVLFLALVFFCELGESRSRGDPYLDYLAAQERRKIEAIEDEQSEWVRLNLGDAPRREV